MHDIDYIERLITICLVKVLYCIIYYSWLENVKENYVKYHIWNIKTAKYVGVNFWEGTKFIRICKWIFESYWSHAYITNLNFLELKISSWVAYIRFNLNLLNAMNKIPSHESVLSNGKLKIRFENFAFILIALIYANLDT